MDGLSGYVIRKNNMGKPCGCNCDGTGGGSAEDPCLNPPCNGGGDPPDDPEVIDTSFFPISGAGSYHVWVHNSKIAGFGPQGLLQNYSENKFELREDCSKPYQRKACSALASGLVPVAVDGWTLLCSFSGIPEIKGDRYKAIIIDNDVDNSKTAGLYWYHLPFIMENSPEDYGEVGERESFSYLNPFAIRKITHSIVGGGSSGPASGVDQYGTPVSLNIEQWETPKAAKSSTLQSNMWAISNSNGSPAWLGRSSQCAAHKFAQDAGGNWFNIYGHSGIAPCKPALSGMWTKGASIIMHKYDKPVAESGRDGLNAPTHSLVNPEAADCANSCSTIFAGIGAGLPLDVQQVTDGGLADNVPDRTICSFGLFTFLENPDRDGFTNYAIGNETIIGQAPCALIEDEPFHVSRWENTVIHGAPVCLGQIHSKYNPDVSSPPTSCAGMEAFQFALCGYDSWTDPTMQGSLYTGGQDNLGTAYEAWANDGNLDCSHFVVGWHNLPPEAFPGVKVSNTYVTNFVGAKFRFQLNQPISDHWLGFYDIGKVEITTDDEGNVVPANYKGNGWTDCFAKDSDGAVTVADFGGSQPWKSYYGTDAIYNEIRLRNNFPEAEKFDNSTLTFNPLAGGNFLLPEADLIAAGYTKNQAGVWTDASRPSGDPRVGSVLFKDLDNPHQDYLRGQEFMGGVPSEYCWGNKALFNYGSGQISGPNSPFYNTDLIGTTFLHFDWMTSDPEMQWPSTNDRGTLIDGTLSGVKSRGNPDCDWKMQTFLATSKMYTTAGTQGALSLTRTYGKPYFAWKWMWGCDYGGAQNFGFSPSAFSMHPANGKFFVRRPPVAEGFGGRPSPEANDFLPADYEDYLTQMENTQNPEPGTGYPDRGGIEQCDGNSWYPNKAISCAFHAYSSGIYSLHFAYNDWEPHFAVVHSDESPLEIANQLNAMTVARLDYLNGGPPSLHTYSEEDERAQYNGTTGGACKCGPGAV